MNAILPFWVWKLSVIKSHLRHKACVITLNWKTTPDQSFEVDL